ATRSATDAAIAAIVGFASAAWKELQNILEKELAEAQAANNVLALLAILLLLGLVVAALSD
ncbi:MAG: hypothetical protein QXY76_06840, partial [Nitrososphaeria archaeon]